MTLTRGELQKAVWDRSVPLPAGEVVISKVAGDRIAGLGKLRHFTRLIPSLRKRFPEAAIVVKVDRYEGIEIIIELRFPGGGLDKGPERTQWLDAEPWRRDDYFSLVVS